jgi:quercetin 2,3-dioxygenase
MMRVWVQRAGERYQGGDGAGIDTRHAFSFSGFYDPDNVRFGPLVACNEERLAPGAGFEPHGHRDVEIVTWVVAGELAHEDSAGHRTVVRPGDLQCLGAGSGVRHAERNAGAEPLRFVQMWLLPGAAPGAAEAGAASGDVGREGPGDGDPRYEVVRGIADATPYALPRAEAVLHVRRLADGERTAVPDAARAYVHVVRGGIKLAETELRAGDAARVTGARDLAAQAVGAAELLVWEMHAEPGRG